MADDTFSFAAAFAPYTEARFPFEAVGSVGDISVFTCNGVVLITQQMKDGEKRYILSPAQANALAEMLRERDVVLNAFLRLAVTRLNRQAF